MHQTNKHFIIEHHEELKALFDKYTVTRSAVYFDNTLVYIYVDMSDKKQFANLNKALTHLCVQYSRENFFKINFFTISNQPAPLPESLIDFSLFIREPALALSAMHVASSEDKKSDLSPAIITTISKSGSPIHTANRQMAAEKHPEREAEALTPNAAHGEEDGQIMKNQAISL